MPPPLVWILADDRPGNLNQLLGVVEALGWPFETKPIRFGPLARLPNAVVCASLLGLTPDARTALAPPWPDLALGAGRRAAPVLRWIRRRSPGTLVVQLMWPGSAEGLDLIAVPEHDLVPPRAHLVRTLGAPHRITPTRLRAAAAALAPRLVDLPRPRIACLMGGSTRRRRFTSQDAEGLAHRASAMARACGGSLLVTTSRRTEAACAVALAAALDAPHFLHRWRAGGDNPYPGLLGSADAVIVTADSASMCTEACATGRPVFLATPGDAAPGKLGRLHERLAALGYLRPLGAPWPAAVPPPLDPASGVAEAIRARLADAPRVEQWGAPSGRAVTAAPAGL